MIGPFENKKTALSFISFMQTKFFRFLVMLNKSTQHATAKVYSFVPIINFTEIWTDQKLYKKFNIIQKDVDFINQMIRSMNVPSEN